MRASRRDGRPALACPAQRLIAPRRGVLTVARIAPAPAMGCAVTPQDAEPRGFMVLQGQYLAFIKGTPAPRAARSTVAEMKRQSPPGGPQRMEASSDNQARPTPIGAKASVRRQPRWHVAPIRKTSRNATT